MKSVIHRRKSGQFGRHWIYIAAFVAGLTGCSGNSNDQPAAQPEPEPEPEPSGRLVGSAIIFPEYRPAEGYLHIRAFDADDVESIAHESSVSFDNADEGIAFEVTLPLGNYGIALAVNNEVSVNWEDKSTFDLSRMYHCDLGAPTAGCNPQGIEITENNDSFINLALYSENQNRDLFLQPNILNIAHGAGQGERPDFTLVAYEYLQTLGPHIIFEADINGTADNIPIVMHDSTLDRKTNFNEINCPDKLPAPEEKHFTHNDCGRISELTFEDISSYDAGYHWTQDDGTSFPYRDQGLSAVSLESLFKRFPDAHYVIELKPEENDGVGSFIQEDLNTGVEVARLINEYRMKHRVTAASFTDEIIKDFRLQDDDILTAFSEAEALPLMLAVFGGDDSYEVPAPAGEFLQIPENYSLNGLDLNLVNDSNVNFLLSAFDLRVHVWTVNENEAMDRMLNVENLAGIMTDFPQMLMQKIDAKASSAE